MSDLRRIAALANLEKARAAHKPKPVEHRKVTRSVYATPAEHEFMRQELAKRRGETPHAPTSSETGQEEGRE